MFVRISFSVCFSVSFCCFALYRDSFCFAFCFSFYFSLKFSFNASFWGFRFAFTVVYDRSSTLGVRGEVR